MDLHSNTLLITGGGSGIGRGLAEAFHTRGNKVIISGRRERVLEAACTANPGMEFVLLDVKDSAQIRRVSQEVISKFPGLSCIINNAGIQRAVDFSVDAVAPEVIDDEIATNLTGLIQTCAAFLPHLRKQARATIINVSSGLGLSPLAKVPVYSATKAAVHTFTLTLRHQLRNSNVDVIELIPPSVATELRAGRDEAVQAGPQPMPLDEYITETMQALERGDQEVAVGTARFGLAAAANDEVRKIFALMNR